ncbi:hypothetical protein [Helicobacter labetoulli]|uniref:hypothetical protein n=1 Tax=Helicobacter labetoulli TaxID=2315333 RepID=UPI000EF71AF8|nr:hypothetical protein [Helicobacter labetoulli]
MAAALGFECRFYGVLGGGLWSVLFALGRKILLCWLCVGSLVISGSLLGFLWAFGWDLLLIGFTQVSRPHIIFLPFSCLFWLCFVWFCLVILPFCLSPHYFCRRPHYFLGVFLGAIFWERAFKKIVLRGFVGKSQGFFYAWESGAKMLKIGKNGLSLVAGLLLVGGLWGLQKMLKKLAFFKKRGRMRAF